MAMLIAPNTIPSDTITDCGTKSVSYLPDLFIGSLFFRKIYTSGIDKHYKHRKFRTGIQMESTRSGQTSMRPMALYLAGELR